VAVSLYFPAPGQVTVRVTDTGIGISEDFLPQLFVEFTQEEGGYDRSFDGTGLGLALTKKFIDASGGSITVESVKGEGTTFYMTFPMYQGTETYNKEAEIAMKESTDTAPQTATGELLNILVVEDDSLTQDFMKILLGKTFNKHFAASAVEANTVLEEHKIDIILMDLSIKGNEDGITLTKAIRNHPDWKNIPIIALTAHAFTRDRENALAAGCNAFFSKPFNRLELMKAIEELAKQQV
jgi:CheY-like chemotaxis protein